MAHADWLTVTLSEASYGGARKDETEARSKVAPSALDQGIHGHVEELLLRAGAEVLDEEPYPVYRLGSRPLLPGKRGTKSGLVKVLGGPGWRGYQMSGLALAALREGDLLRPLLAVIAEVPHTVTTLHIAHDVLEDGADAFQRSLVLFASGRYSLSRKSVGVSWLRNIRSSDGRATGTCYVGTAGNKLSLKIYDKRNETLDKTGMDTGQPCTRYELALGDGKRVGMTLRDACEPDALFWAHMPAAILAPPSGAPRWVVSDATGYFASHVPPREPYEVLRRRVDFSTELGAFVRLADTVGPHGRALLLSLLEERFRRLGEPSPRTLRAA